MLSSKSNEKELPELLTLEEASEVLKCHPNTLRQWDKKGILVALRFGARGDRKYRKDDILKLLNQKL
jgi:excisionase family DNA binding protein